jgi:putative DNA primase/helicase
MSLFEDRSVDADKVPAALTTVRVSQVERERVRWLWHGRIPLGKLAVLDGDPGLGKSTVALYLTSCITTGTPLPGETDRLEPASVVLLSAEDAVADTIRPRLEATGADLDRVLVVDHVTDHQGARPVELPGDLEQVEALVRAEAAVLLVVDPLMAFLSGTVDANKDQHVRRALHRLKLTAERTGAAVLSVRHLNKLPGGNPLYRGGGSIGLVGAARAGLLIAPEPREDGIDRRVLAVIKSNLAAKPASLAYRLVNDDLYGVARVVWEEEVSYSAADLLGVHRVERPSPKQDKAEAMLRALLADGPKLRSWIQEQTERKRLSWKTVQRAADALEVEAERRPEPGKRGRGPSWWSLPNTGHEDATEPGEQGEVSPQVSDAATSPGIQGAIDLTAHDLYSSAANPQVSGHVPSPNGIQDFRTSEIDS